MTSFTLPIAMAPLSRWTLSRVALEKKIAQFRSEGMLSSVTNLWRSGETARIGGIAVADRHVFIGTETAM